jgi:site-specific recombinase
MVALEGTKVNLPVVALDSNQTVLCQKWKRDVATWIHNNKIACYLVKCGIFREEGGFHHHSRGKNVTA